MEEDSTSTRQWLFLSATTLAFLWIARQYPAFRAKKILDHEPFSSSSSSQQQPPSDLPSDSEKDALPSSVWPENFSLRWIPYIPFAVVYLVARALWKALQFIILHTLFAMEQAGVFTAQAAVDSVEWSVTHGPAFVKSTILDPIHASAVAVWTSPAMAQFKLTVETKAIPALAQLALTTQTFASETGCAVVAHIQTLAQPISSALTWIAIECVYNPIHGVLSRCGALGHAFLQTAKIYLGELAKDAMDLGRIIVKAGQWLWERTLQPVGKALWTLGNKMVEGAMALLPWLGQKIFSGLILPVSQMAVDGFRILRSHPTLLLGMQAISTKVHEKGSQVLQRLESVNWLILLETVLTQVFTTLYSVTVKALQVMGEAIRVFAVDVVPNAYSDLMHALEVAKPIVGWVIEKFLMVVHPVWQVVSWLSWTIIVNARSTGATLHQHVIVPTVRVWESSILPEMTKVGNVILSQTKFLSDVVIKTVPVFLAIAQPMWNAVLVVVDSLQRLLVEVGAQIVVLSGGLGVTIQRQLEVLGPQFEAFKVQSGRMMDEAVLVASNLMMDWVKKEKRD